MEFHPRECGRNDFGQTFHIQSEKTHMYGYLVSLRTLLKLLLKTTCLILTSFILSFHLSKILNEKFEKIQGFLKLSEIEPATIKQTLKQSKHHPPLIHFIMGIDIFTTNMEII